MSANQAKLEGVLAEPIVWRTTPAGLVTARLLLAHQSLCAELDPLQHLAVQLPVLALGPLAEQCRPWQPGWTVLAEGRLNQPRWTRNNSLRWGQMELVATHLRATPPAQPDASPGTIAEGNIP